MYIPRQQTIALLAAQAETSIQCRVESTLHLKGWQHLRPTTDLVIYLITVTAATNGSRMHAFYSN